MFVLLIVCLIKLYEMYTNKMARNRCDRNSKENHFGLDANTHKRQRQQQRIEMFDNILNNERYRDQLDQQYDINHNYARLIQQKTGKYIESFFCPCSLQNDNNFTLYRSTTNRASREIVVC